MFRPSRVSVSGPLAEFAVGFAAELAGLGYSPPGAEAQLRLMNHVSSWIVAQGLMADDLNGEVVAAFVAARRGRYSNFRSDRALVPLLRFLRGRGAVPVAPVVAPTRPVEVLVGRFGRYLRMQRGLELLTE